MVPRRRTKLTIRKPAKEVASARARAPFADSTQPSRTSWIVGLFGLRHLLMFPFLSFILIPFFIRFRMYLIALCIAEILATRSC